MIHVLGYHATWSENQIVNLSVVFGIPNESSFNGTVSGLQDDDQAPDRRLTHGAQGGALLVRRVDIFILQSPNPTRQVFAPITRFITWQNTNENCAKNGVHQASDSKSPATCHTA